MIEGPIVDRQIGHRVRLDLPVGVDAPGAARHAFDAIQHGLDPTIEYTVKLLISELVSNSVKHCGQGSVHVEIEAMGGNVRVDVSDHGPAFVPGPRTAAADAEGGWGLVLVDQLADRWGSFHERSHVWFEVDGVVTAA
ncbi:MAG TPA: ATP-binding protein [Thermoleophilaceae bacterium]